MNQENLTIEEIHQYTLIILRKVIKICSENNIRYFLAYGSLIGAVRHHGFIPWDDDCDILMLRPEYDRFVAYCNAHSEELQPFRLMNHQNTEGYPFGISRFCDTRFEMVREESDSVGMGLFVDIYPYDGMGNGKRREHYYIAFYRTYYTRMATYAHLYHYTDSTKKAVNLIRKVLYRRAKRKGTEYYLIKLEKLAKKFPYETSKYVGAIIWGIGDYHFEKAFFEEEETFLEFEGIPVSVPKRYHELLTLGYGDYMQLPPEDQRQFSHGYKLFRKQGAVFPELQTDENR